VWVDARGIRVEVGDGSPHLPHRCSYGPTAQTGRGLALLELQATEWGVRAEARGKVVWFRVDLTPRAFQAAEAEPHELIVGGGRGKQSLDVVLLEVPLAMFAVWRQHAETVLREYLLATLEDEAIDDPLEHHAAATDAIAVLAGAIPDPPSGESPADVLARVSEPLVTAERIQLPVPVPAVPHFRTLGTALDAANDLADAGRFLGPPIQPELGQLRRWLCEQVDSQGRGAPPAPWAGSYPTYVGPAPAQAPVRLPHDDAVSRSRVAMIAADEHSQIAAISEPALMLLGYDSEQQLLGHRLLAVIPHRYRQAHLAGFTQHLLTGRQPLLDTTVEVPALRRDGTEVPVALHIERQHHDGETWFVAILRPVS